MSGTDSPTKPKSGNHLTQIAKETDMRYYDTIAEFEREGYNIIVDKSWEDIQLRDCFDDSCYDIKEMEDQVNSGQLDWFMLRVRVMVEGLELADEYLGGCLYKDAREVLTDGTAEDIIDQAMTRAKQQVYRLSRKFTELSDAVDREGVVA
jgi:hypothetical protein